MNIRYGLYLMELVACVTGFIFYAKIKNTFWKWFPLYLGVIFLSEIMVHYTGVALQWHGFSSGMSFYWNIPLEFLFFFYLFHGYFRGGRYAWLPAASAAVYLLAKAADAVWVKYNTFSFTSLSYMAGNALLLVLLLLFFIRFAVSSDILYYRSNLMFWVCIGLVVFYLGTLPFFALWNNLLRHYPRVWEGYWKVMMALNYIMYGFFTLGLIWSRKKS